MKKILKLLIYEEDAQALVEYAFLLAMFAVVSYAGINLFIDAWRHKFNVLKSVRSGVSGILP